MLSTGAAHFVAIVLFLLDPTSARHAGVSFVNSHRKTQQSLHQKQNDGCQSL